MREKRDKFGEKGFEKKEYAALKPKIR